MKRGYVSDPTHWRYSDALRTGLQFLSVGVGMPAAMAWPWSGAATIGLVALALGFLGTAWIRSPRERPASSA